MCASHSLENVAPMMELLKEMDRHGTRVPLTMAQVGKCKVLLKDNSGAIEMAKVCASVILEPSISMSSCVTLNWEPSLCMLSSQRISWWIAFFAKPLNCGALKVLWQQVMGDGKVHNKIMT